MKKIKKTIYVCLIILGIMAVINILAWLSTDFSDFYTAHIFPPIMAAFSAVSGFFHFSVGEVMLKILTALIIIIIPSFVILMIFRKKSRKKISLCYCTTVLVILTYILTTETMNCFIMYHCTKFSEKYFSSSQHNDKQLTELYKILIDKSNELSSDVTRDENGRFVLTADLCKTAKSAMRNISDTYPQLKGYYPDAKAIHSDFFMSQNSLLGIYFPFSFEANYNPATYDINLPNTVCHEYAHLKGIIQEDEAGFTAFIASVNSSSPEFQYSGYINALEYVYNQVYENKITSAYALTNTISDKVEADWFSFVPDNYWNDNKEKEIIPNKTVDTISNIASDTSLKLNGVEDGQKSYSRIVDLLLDYYFNS